MRRRRAFTLIELLVVVAILGTLVSLLLPSLGMVRARARSVTCRNNLHQLGLAIHLYADEHRERFPFTNHAGDDLSWVQTLKPYTEDVDHIRVCPDDPQREEWLSGDRKGTSYVINEYVSNPAVSGAINRMSQISGSSRVIVLFEGADGRTENTEHAHCSSYYSPLRVANGWVFSAMQSEIDTARHGKGSNYLFADGHAASIDEGTIRQWIEEDIANGTNFTLPRQ
ncbi:MAG: DUF1559 domain-containing protein [Pirellulales bacterium]|nr:DUF1559 domain-containing protein [Pirellulales bacterium]